jgi:hypothetical protein
LPGQGQNTDHLARLIKTEVSARIEASAEGPNGPALWEKLSREISGFLHGLFVDKALRGSTPKDAYFVKIGTETMTQSDIDRGLVNIVVGFAPVHPAEFVVITIGQWMPGAKGGTGCKALYAVTPVHLPYPARFRLTAISPRIAGSSIVAGMR